MLIYSIQRQWVPIVIVFYCSREVADGFQYYTPFVWAGGSTKGESKAHQSKLKLRELRLLNLLYERTYGKHTID